MSSVTLQSNKQIDGGTDGLKGGGGLYLQYKVTANIRECTFIRNEATEGSTGNKHGHQIFTLKSGSDIPSIAIVNTNFTDVSGSHAFYGYDSSTNTHSADKYVSPTTCASNPCTVTPFTGDCFAHPLGDKNGVLCDYGGTVVCPAGSYKQPVGYASQPLPPAESACATSKPEWDCTRSAGEEFQRSTDCSMPDEVAVSGDLTVTGKETVYSTLTAASGKRHFKITSGAHRVSLSWLNLTGGNVGGSNNGGSIYVYNVAAHLNLSLIHI